MTWWPSPVKYFLNKFGKSQKINTNVDSQIHVKGTRVWIQELQEVCEKNFNSPHEGKRLIREMQIEWKDAAKRKEIKLELIEGLDRRAFYLLKANDDEWTELLDNLSFWRPGWKAD
ncbi:MAG: hypothetical protein VX277_00545 [Candidatus Thermoplasmatota archaeon]|nr:hypothetical protein [Candidatus Thermoplasmatota archaeon]